jgi:adenylate cyclase class IV
MEGRRGDVVEVEVRGPLTDGQAHDLLQRFSGAEGSRKVDRFLVNFTNDAMRERGIDVRVRLTNGEGQIVAKRGKFLGEARVETIIDLRHDQFEAAVTLLSMLEVSEGVACRRLISEFPIDGTLIALVHVPGHSWFYEAERTCCLGEEETCRQDIVRQLTEMGLGVFSEEQFVGYVAVLDAEANVCIDTRHTRIQDCSLYPTTTTS